MSVSYIALTNVAPGFPFCAFPLTRNSICVPRTELQIVKRKLDWPVSERCADCEANEQQARITLLLIADDALKLNFKLIVRQRCAGLLKEFSIQKSLGKDQAPHIGHSVLRSMTFGRP